VSTADLARQRVLLLLPTSRDAQLAGDVLGRHGIATHRCIREADLIGDLELGAGAVLLGEEMLGATDGPSMLREVLRAQPRWSDLPILLLTRSGADSDAVLEAIGSLGNIILMERPMRVAALVSMVRAALRARARQYQIQSHLAELERARQAADEEARRKDEFLAMLAHELRNPLAPIRNALQVLELDEGDPARRHQLRTMMLRQVEHLVRLVDDLLEASRLSQGKIELQLRPLDLRDVLSDTTALVRMQADQRAPTVELELPAEPLPVLGDAVRLAQVFGNLLNNARKYVPADGHIRVGARAQDGQLLAWVRDDGQGIAPDLLPHVFELFTQGRRDVHRLHDGLGIGLALVRGLVAMHGGSVEARSAGRGQGAEFLVRLPQDRSRPAATQRSMQASGSDGFSDQPGVRVLVVDDNEDSAHSLALLLEAMGHEPRVATGGEEGIAVAGQFHPQVALLDIGMPGLDGYEVARRLRSDPRHAGLLLAAITGWGDAQDRERARDAGFDHHFRKPVSVRDLSDLLQGPVASSATTRGCGG
jgi:signal transduction histidine kinase/ActR/RegA family two-component response regulator